MSPSRLPRVAPGPRPGCLILLLLLAAPAGLGAQPRFEDVTGPAGIDWTHRNGATPEKYLIETMGGGGAFLDYDRDGWLDILLVDSGPHRHSAAGPAARHALYRNRGDGTFREVTAGSGLEGPGYGMGVAVGDYDNDGLPDLYLTRFGDNSLYRNNGDGTFRDVAGPAGVTVGGWSTSAAFFDLDNDGDLDLFVCLYLDWDYQKEMYCGQPREGYRSYCHPLRYQPVSNVLFRNNGDGTFDDITREGGMDVPGKALGVVTGDIDGDGLADVFVANDAVANFLFKNRGQASFQEIGVLAGVAFGIYGKAESGMGTDFGDYDQDGRIDLIVTNLDNEMNNLYVNQGEDWFRDLTLQAGLGQVALPYSGFGVRFLDLENDGDLDLVVLNGHVQDNIHLYRAGVDYAEPSLLLENTGDGGFRDIGGEGGPIFQKPLVGRALAAGDYDNDGDPDLLFVNNGQPAHLLRNQAGGGNTWLGVRLVGSRSNRDGVGAVLRLHTDRRTLLRERHGGGSYQAAQDPRIVFGLAEGEVARKLEIRWPGGNLQQVTDLHLLRYQTIREP